MLTRIELQRVNYIPTNLTPGILYVAEEYGAVAHLCACGCGDIVRTPLGPTEWILIVDDGGATLSPSIGNWQQACQSHYWIKNGEIIEARKWTPEEVAMGRQAEELRREEFYSRQKPQRAHWFLRVVDRIRAVLPWRQRRR